MNVHIGRRALVLIMFGLAFVTFGFAIWHHDEVREVPLYALTPLWIQGGAWVLAGVVSVLAALTSSKEWLGFTVLLPMPMLWAGAHIVGAITNDLSISGAVTWSLTSAILFIIAGWPEPPSRPTVDDGAAREL